MSILSAIARMFAIIDKAMTYFANRKIGKAAVAESTLKQLDEVERRVEEAKAAVSVPDPVRDERLRSKYDRSRSK
jgi:hypothetical protein